jgi:translation elongation factor EF-Tu-like GTPase
LAAPPVRAVIDFDPPSELVMPGDTFGCSIDLLAPTGAVEGQPFDVLESGKVVGHGVVRLAP